MSSAKHMKITFQKKKIFNTQTRKRKRLSSKEFNSSDLNWLKQQKTRQNGFPKKLLNVKASLLDVVFWVLSTPDFIVAR